MLLLGLQEWKNDFGSLCRKRKNMLHKIFCFCRVFCLIFLRLDLHVSIYMPFHLCGSLAWSYMSDKSEPWIFYATCIYINSTHLRYFEAFSSYFRQLSWLWRVLEGNFWSFNQASPYVFFPSFLMLFHSNAWLLQHGSVIWRSCYGQLIHFLLGSFTEILWLGMVCNF